MQFLALSLVAAFIGLGATAPAPSGHVLHERRSTTNSPWKRAERLDAKDILPMRIGLLQNNLHIGHDLLMEVSTTGSSNYGKYYTSEQIDEIFAPAAEAVEAVRTWVESTGIAAERISQSTNKQWLQFDAEVWEAEQLFGAEYHVYEHVESSKTNIACDEYHVPAHLKDHIDYITPGIKLHSKSGLPRPSTTLGKRTSKGPPSHGRKPPPSKPMPTSINIITDAELALCDIAITPPCIKAMYNITTGTTAVAGNQLGIFEDLGDIYSQTDLNLFFATLAPYIPQGTHPTLDAIDGAVAPTSVLNAGPESDLDFQISYPIIWPQQSILYQTDDPVYEDDYVFEGFLNNFFDGIDGSYCTYSADGETGNSPLDPPYPDPAAGGYKGQLQCGVYSPTNVISISYGGAEADLPVSYQRRQCSEIMKLGMRGITVVVASGDSGVSSVAGDPTADGCLGDGNIFNPDFPATCPYITAVGSTYLPPGGDPKKDEEVATTRFPSGGGFSNIYAVSEASYQESAVSAYFAKNLVDYPYYSTVNNESIGANGGIYNRNGRGYPDLAAIGDNVVIFNEGEPELIGGTSAAAPTFAAILTRINEIRLTKGMSTVGFVNPTLYANPQAFHDITVGNNSGCGTAGFYASTGWDPVTGLGTPNFPALVDVFTS